MTQRDRQRDLTSPMSPNVALLLLGNFENQNYLLYTKQSRYTTNTHTHTNLQHIDILTHTHKTYENVIDTYR